MPDIVVTALDGGTITLDAETMEGFTGNFGGSVVTADSPDYDEVRSIWNAMIDRRPGLVARCSGTEDVVRCVKLAREHGILTAVRGAGHNIAGNSICDGGLVIDLSTMTSVHVDGDNRTVQAEPGATLGDLDSATQAFGLAVPVGINSTTGVGGLTLGGGFGWLSRKHGLTVDNLISAEVVTAEGERVRASESENPDLFWGIRGGGGNFGVVTSFEYRAHAVGPQVLAGLVVHPFDDARGVLDHYREFTADAPDELTVWVVMRQAHPLPFLPEDVHGKEIVILAMLYAGTVEDGELATRGIREYGDPIADVMAPQDFTAWQAAFDPLLLPGARNYWKSHNFLSLGDELIEELIRFSGDLPTPHTEIFVAHMGGATSRVASGATPYLGREAQFILNVHTRWEDPAEDDPCVTWSRTFFEATAPYAAPGAYINFMPHDEAQRVGFAYGDNWDRLVDLKNRYDPTNLFRLNHNIEPTVSA